MRTKSSGGGFGLLGMVIVVAIVAWLAMKAFGTTHPVTRDLTRTARQVEAVQQNLTETNPNSGESTAGNNTGALPNLSEMKANTAAHTRELGGGLQESNQ